MAFIQDRIVNPIRTSKSAQLLAYGALALFVAYVLLTRVTGNLPDVMGDELVYANATLHQPWSSAAIPDYLYYWVYSSTGVCGIGFYGCSQVLNTIFSLGAGLLVLVIARRFVSLWASIFIALVFVLGPLSASNSYFMPESMYYFFLALLLWHLTKQVEQRALGFWIQGGVYLALLSLVKPHALLLIPGIGTYLIFTQWGDRAGRWVKLIKEGGSFLLSTAVVKFGLGLIFAGPAGLTLFGSSYSGTLNNTLNGGTPAPVAAPAPGVLDRSFGASLGFIFSQIGVQTLAVVFLGALPIAAAIRYLVRNKSVLEKNKPLADFSFLILNTLVWMIVLIAIFSNMTRLAGEDTANRIMLRYFEFLIPLLLITLVATAEKGLNVKPVVRWLSAGVTGVLTIVASVYLTQPDTTTGAQRYHIQFVDSPMLKVLLDTSSPDGTGKQIYWMAIVVAVTTVIALLMWASNPKWGAVTWVALFTPVLLVLTNSAMISNYAWRSNYTMASDTAGEFVRDSIPSAELKNLVIVAPSNTNKSELVAKFHINNADVQTATVPEGAPYKLDDSNTSIKWVLALGNVELQNAGWTVAQANGVQLLRRDLSDVELFNNRTHVGVLLNGQTGLVIPSAQGLCSNIGAVTFTLNKPVNSGDVLRFGLSANSAGSGQTYTVQVGDQAQSIRLYNPQRPLDATLVAGNTSPVNQVTLTMPQVQGAGVCVSYLELLPAN